jgi:translation initiation factor 1
MITYSESEELDFKNELKHLDRESAHFAIRLEKHHSGRNVTVIQPRDTIRDSIDLEQLMHKLKETIGTGGNIENGRIILHGDHREKTRDELVKHGFAHIEDIEMI